MKKTAVIICNYNKKEYVKKNIEALKRQTVSGFAVFVVDNASTDGSADTIEQEYAPEVHVIRNTKNLGGSGGFNTGIRAALKMEYEYLILLDNDVVLQEDAVGQMVRDMDEYPDIGIMGAKILKMDYPDVIQEFAPSVNYETMTFEVNHMGDEADIALPHLSDCDYVPACALIVRREVIEAIGMMPEDNFIYYDDIEWGIRCHRAGYRVVANSHVTVWHKGGGIINPTTFSTYYINRNKLRFFMKYKDTEGKTTPSDAERNARIDGILREIYEGIYASIRKRQYNVAKTRMDGFCDALAGITGKADEEKIRKIEDGKWKFADSLKNVKRVCIYMHGLTEDTGHILYYMLYTKNRRDLEIDLVDSMHEGLNLFGYVVRSAPTAEESDFDLTFHVCKHIYELSIDTFDKKWCDRWKNTIFDEDDFAHYRAFNASYQVFKILFEDKVRNRMRILEGDYGKETP